VGETDIRDHAVIHPDTMKVHGLDGVRGAGASVMPTVTNANTYAQRCTAF
jgi:choline dehydrogenase